jgi:hypothetical protein
VTVIVPAVAVNATLVEPPSTVTKVGVVRSGLLLVSVTETPPVGAAWERVTPHVAVAPDPKLVGLHDSEETTTDTTRLIVAGAELPL